MNLDQFRTWARRAADWSADYHEGIRDRPVRPAVDPGDILAQLPLSPPEEAEPMEAIFGDFEKVIVPGMTHWQHPRFFAYFPSNASHASMVAETLASALAAQCMLWQTSPAATELETRSMDWLRQAVGLPDDFAGVIQDSASAATLCAVLTMRERALDWAGNEDGLSGRPPVRIYCSEHVHSSIDKAIWIAGIGRSNLIKIPALSGRTGATFEGMDIEALEAAIISDKKAGMLPAGIIPCVGSTSIGSCDNVAAAVALAKKHDLYVHVDAAWAGSAMICPEFRELWAGVEGADSVVLNPHKWMGIQFDCSAHFVRNPDDLIRTLAAKPEYLKTHGKEGLINYSEWSVPLGRRFRALKIWFTLRAHGLKNLRQIIRNHVAWAQELAEKVSHTDGYEIVTEPFLSLFSFRFVPRPGLSASQLDALQVRLVNAINDDGVTYVTQTLYRGRCAIRFVAGTFNTTEDDVTQAWDAIQRVARRVGQQLADRGIAT